jgi:large subunit ribosomal protein L29
MEAGELRNFSIEELRSRIRQWRDELFRSRFKAESSEAKDTSVFKKLKKDIARAGTVLNEKLNVGGPVESPPPAIREAKAPEPERELPVVEEVKPMTKAVKGKKKASRKTNKGEE